jgi:deazaflavin-dependent oxidoreductase (nitroreductase family)
MIEMTADDPSITPSSYLRAHPLQRAIRRAAASGPGSWLFARVLHRIDNPVYRLSRGRHTFTSLLAGLPIVMLTTTGARSGQPRSVPIVGLPTDQGLAVIASNFGQNRHPAWYHNLRAHPEATITVDGRTRPVRAVEVDGERRRRIWDEGLRVYPGWSQYDRRTPNREIAIFVLEPQ